MRWTEGKYEHRWKHTDNYWAWMDILYVMWTTFVLAVIAAIVIFLLLILLNPRVATAGDIVNFRKERRLAAVMVAPIEKVTTRAAKPVKILYMEVSAYSPTVAECDGNPHMTASGKHVYVGGIAADLRILPFGSIVTIKGYNGGKPCTVIDTGGAIRGLKLDVFFWNPQDSVNWGRRRNVRVQVIYIPRRK